MTQNAVEDTAVLFIAVESIVKKRAQEPSALGDAESVGALDIVFRIAQDCPRAAVFQKRDQVANGGWAQAHQDGILGGVDHFIDLAGLESRGHHHSRAIFDVPVRARHGATRALAPVANGQRELRIIGIQRRVRNMIAIGERVAGLSAIEDQLGAHETGDVLIAVASDRCVEPHQSFALRDVELPAEPYQCEAAIEEKVIAELFGRARVGRSRRRDRTCRACLCRRGSTPRTAPPDSRGSDLEA